MNYVATPASSFHWLLSQLWLTSLLLAQWPQSYRCPQAFRNLLTCNLLWWASTHKPNITNLYFYMESKIGAANLRQLFGPQILNVWLTLPLSNRYDPLGSVSQWERREPGTSCPSREIHQPLQITTSFPMAPLKFNLYRLHLHTNTKFTLCHIS